MNENTTKKVDESWKEQAKKEAVKKEPEVKEAQQETVPLPEANFMFFLSTLGMQVWIALGKIPNPMTNTTEENLQQANYLIDILGILQEKTKGNLNSDETQMLENLLFETRSIYIQRTTATDQTK